MATTFRVAVFGSGGSLYDGRLVRSGCIVTLVGARADHVEAVRVDGLRIDVGDAAANRRVGRR